MLQIVSLGTSRSAVTPYENMIRRVHRQINSAAAQVRRRTVISRQPGESQDDWDKFLEQLDIEESVRVMRLECGSAGLCWTNQHMSSTL